MQVLGMLLEQTSCLLLATAVLHPWRGVVVTDIWGMFSYSLRMGKEHKEVFCRDTCFCHLKSSKKKTTFLGIIKVISVSDLLLLEIVPINSVSLSEF